MGNVVEKLRSRSRPSLEQSQTRRGQKRSAKVAASDGNVDTIDLNMMDTPRRKKMKTTSKYIYETLFINGEGSDITVTALGETWKLHKLYISQSPYFKSMLSGSWKESTMSTIHIDIPDPAIDADALRTTFGCFYRDEVEISGSRVLSIVAAASLFQFETLLIHCMAVMKELISPITVCTFYEASQIYGLHVVDNACCRWFDRNLMTCATQHKDHFIDILKNISIEWMVKFISSPSLYAISVESDIYHLVKRFIYLKMFPDWSGTIEDLTRDAQAYFTEKRWVNMPNDPTSSTVKSNAVLIVPASPVSPIPATFFLESPQGRQFVSLIRAIRLQHMINDGASISKLSHDHIVPRTILLRLYEMQWQTLIRLESGIDQGPVMAAVISATDEEGENKVLDTQDDVPSSQPPPPPPSLAVAAPGLSEVNEMMFDKHCFRCGRFIDRNAEYCWRWTGFGFGTDLLITFAQNLLIVKRNTGVHHFTGSVYLGNKRSFLIKASISSLDENGQSLRSKSTKLMMLKLRRDEEYILLSYDHHLQFPLYISVRFLFYTPPLTLPYSPGELLVPSSPSNTTATTTAAISDHHRPANQSAASGNSVQQNSLMSVM